MALIELSALEEAVMALIVKFSPLNYSLKSILSYCSFNIFKSLHNFQLNGSYLRVNFAK